MLQIKTASPSHSIQDLGRFGFASQGVAQSGPMDMTAACWANYCIGNSVSRALLEIGGGGFHGVFTEDTSIGIAGAWGDIRLNGAKLLGPGCFPVEGGSTLVIRGLVSGFFTYIAVKNGFVVKESLGSVSTCGRDNLGGAHGDGRALATNDEVSYFRSNGLSQSFVSRRFVPGYLAPLVCEVILNDHGDFDECVVTEFLRQAYTVSKDVSRMGYRLHGKTLINGKAPRYSRPMPLGGIQIPSGGHPIVLMRDHQSLGGYPLIGSVTRPSLSLLAQRVPGQQLSFRAANRGLALSEFKKFNEFFGDYR